LRRPGNILKGEKPVNIPVWQPTKSANALGVQIPNTPLAIADEVRPAV
jgi:hypothetical protein